MMDYDIPHLRLPWRIRAFVKATFTTMIHESSSTSVFACFSARLNSYRCTECLDLIDFAHWRSSLRVVVPYRFVLVVG